VPFEKLVEELNPFRDLSRNPLCQVALQFLDIPVASGAGGSSGAPGLAIDKQTSIFDMVVTMSHGPDGIHGSVEYSTDLFDEATIARMFRHYERLLGGMVEHPEQRVSELPILAEEERRQIVCEWNDTARDVPTDLTFHELFEAQVARTPDAIAVTFGGVEWSYDTLNRRANQLAAHLRSLGVGPDVLVAVSIERSLEMVVAALGTLKAGGAYVPLDPSYPPERLAFMLADSDAPVLLTQDSLRSRIPETRAKVVCLDTDWPAMERHPDGNLPDRRTSRMSFTRPVRRVSPRA
jgi:non-ribosomal peptide synthetase component F